MDFPTNFSPEQQDKYLGALDQNPPLMTDDPRINYLVDRHKDPEFTIPYNEVEELYVEEARLFIERETSKQS